MQKPTGYQSNTPSKFNVFLKQVLGIPTRKKSEKMILEDKKTSNSS